jgi:hypothetical protein
MPQPVPLIHQPEAVDQEEIHVSSNSQTVQNVTITMLGKDIDKRLRRFFRETLNGTDETPGHLLSLGDVPLLAETKDVMAVDMELNCTEESVNLVTMLKEVGEIFYKVEYSVGPAIRVPLKLIRARITRIHATSEIESDGTNEIADLEPPILYLEFKVGKTGVQVIAADE